MESLQHDIEISIFIQETRDIYDDHALSILLY